ncbi:hypothetical protein CDO73_26135 [Saccharibacillus sp. O23]|uniref:hypothetical protein n=1 Tax=Saccharibacillus sp. O23 TaxID=2009338 RepID=UPI000B4E2563|nr:hypothetical protein [Saccharibacillus sp. O23]OWR25661.1 hypothetical protein CDO73_26135 [Saccharibacillus sp. O23]
MKFACSNDQMEWTGEIKRYTVYEGGHYYLYISARDSGIDVYFGRAEMAQWIVSMPGQHASLILDNLRNVSYNAEKICDILENDIDGVSIAQALCVFADEKKIQEQDSSAAFMDALKAAGYEPADQ